MPGIVGWLGPLSKVGLVPEHALAAISSDYGNQVCKAAGVRHGELSIVYANTTGTTFGVHCDELTNSVLGYRGEFYGDEFSGATNGAETCAVLLRLLGDDPASAFCRLNGSFVLFLQRGNRVWVANDTVASRPICYGLFAGALVLAPDLKFFGLLAGPRPKLDRNAMVSLVVNGHAISDQTFYRDVKLLRPGHYIQCDAETGKVQVERYWNYVPAKPGARDLGEVEYRDRLASVLRGAIRRRSSHLENSIIPISGGFDSRGILACIREIYSGRLKTVSWGTDEDTPDADAAIGRRVAHHFGTEHVFLPRRSDLLQSELETEIHRIDAATDDCFFHHHEPALIRQIRSELGCTVLFRGDESFGYTAPASTALEALGRVNVRDLSQYPDLQTLMQAGVRSELLNEQRQTYREVLDGCPFQGHWTIAKDWYYLEQRIFRSLNVYNYMKLAFLEARNPWLDREVLEFFAELPEHYRYDKVLYQATLRTMFPDLMLGVPMAARNSLENWQRILLTEEYRLYFRRQLVQSESAIHEIWDPSRIDSLIERLYSGHRTASLRTSAYESIKSTLRSRVNPLYRVLKKNLPAKTVMRELPAYQVLARLVTLKLWCDRWA